jgi:hypothetical protein
MEKTGAAGENPRTRFRGPQPLLPRGSQAAQGESSAARFDEKLAHLSTRRVAARPFLR